MTTTKLPELPATYPYVARLVRIFSERPDDDTSALVLLDYGEACRAIYAAMLAAAQPPARGGEPFGADFIRSIEP